MSSARRFACVFREAKIAKWESLITSTTAKVTEAEAELAAVNATITDIQTAIAAEQAICDGTVTGTEAGTFYLHADHLGRPQFATDSDGAIVWDMGEGVTPFGEGVNLAGAFAQKLMFPGQYADAETGEDVVLSHNWHRTYDPTLGRYLQSDPIGLAGGLNRYVYGLNDPNSNIDPTGEAVPLVVWGAMAFGAAFDIFWQTKVERKTIECINLTSTLVSFGLGALPGTSLIKPYKAWKEATKSQKGIRRFVNPNFDSVSRREAIDDGMAAVGLGAGAFTLGLEIPKYLPEVKVHDVLNAWRDLNWEPMKECPCKQRK